MYVPLAVLLTVAGLQVPVMPLVEVAGSSAGTTPPEQIASVVPNEKTGVTVGVTETFNVKGVAHWPAVGVNVYVPLAALLIAAGLQVPVIPFVDVAGSAGTVLPEQIDKVVPKPNEGVSTGFTVTLKVAVVAHWPASGVKVYVPLLLLLTVAGLQVPVIPLLEVPGKLGTLPPEQMDNEVPKLKAGVTFGVTVTVNVAVVAH